MSHKTSILHAAGAALFVIRCGLAMAPAPTQAQTPAQGSASPAPAIYTNAQAERGKALYLENCGSCHGPNLSGSPMAPPLGRGLFVGGRRSFRELFDYVQLFMPVFSPGGLSRQQNADILAFVLQTAGLPAGSSELPVNPEAQDAITFTAR